MVDPIQDGFVYSWELGGTNPVSDIFHNFQVILWKIAFPGDSLKQIIPGSPTVYDDYLFIVSIFPMIVFTLHFILSLYMVQLFFEDHHLSRLAFIIIVFNPFFFYGIETNFKRQLATILIQYALLCSALSSSSGRLLAVICFLTSIMLSPLSLLAIILYVVYFTFRYLFYV
ncbi:MAG: hypothetical protein ACFFG0_44595, partial [Candidatus Thorarchaeota archaeon]